MEGEAFFAEELQKLFRESLTLVARELTGRYDDVETKVASYTLKNSESNRYFRGNQIDAFCQKIVIRNLRDWLVAIPVAESCKYKL